ncbi:hypothetical protein KM043_006789 [Ampulex compressa]|nr:hypothetical protein KM043_006789 [Ampulex compressa]
MKVKWKFKTIFLLFALIPNTICEENYDEEVFKTDTLDYSPGTFLVSKFLLLPTLATLGLKFLLLMPVFLSKIALLGIMNFVSSNLNLLLSGLIALKNYFNKDKFQWNNQDHRQADFEYFYPNQNIPDVNQEAILYHQYQPSDAYVAETKMIKNKQSQVPQNLDTSILYGVRNPVAYQTLYKCKRKTYGLDTGKYACWTEVLAERETNVKTEVNPEKHSTQNRKVSEVSISPSHGNFGKSRTGSRKRMQ